MVILLLKHGHFFKQEPYPSGATLMHEGVRPTHPERMSALQKALHKTG